MSDAAPSVDAAPDAAPSTETFDVVEIGPERAASIASDETGGFLLAGAMPDAEDRHDAWIARYDAAGRERWSHVFEVYEVDQAGDVTMQPDGTIAVVGGSSRDGQDDGWYARYTGEGERIALYSFDSGYGGDGKESVAASPDGTLFVAGMIGTGEDRSEPWLARYDQDGVEIWSFTRSLPPGDRATLSRVAVGTTGNVAMVIQSVGPDAEGALVAKFDADGAELWAHRYGTRYVEEVVVGPDDTVFVTGREQWPESQLWGNAYDASGEERWSVGYDGPLLGESEGEAISVAPDGGVFIGGSVAADALGHVRLAWLGRYDANGEEVWTTTFEPNAEDIQSLATDPAGNALVLYMTDDLRQWVRRVAP